MDFYIFPWLNGDINVNNMQSILANRINKMLEDNGLTLNDCVESSVQTTWYVDLKIGSDQIIFENFYEGYGYTDVPTNNSWRNALIASLPNLYNYGFTFVLNGNFLKIVSTTCTEKNLEEIVKLNIGINISINCDNTDGCV